MDSKPMSRTTIKRLIREFHAAQGRWPTVADLGKGGLPDRLEIMRHFKTLVAANRAVDQSKKRRRKRSTVAAGTKATDAMWKRLPGSFESRTGR
jgi:hypothetical protein